MNKPLVSVVIPSYNSGKFIEETIQSVIEQTYDNIELFVIDGGSTDQTVNIIKKYEDKISYWVSEPDKGQSNAINKGFKKARGKYVGWIGADDILYPYTVKKIVEVFETDEQIGTVYGDVDKINDRGEIFLKQKSKLLTIDYLVNVHATFLQPGSFFRKKFVEQVGYIDETLHQVMDYDLFLRLLEVSRCYYVGMPLAKFRMHQTNKSTVQGGWVGSIEGFRVSRQHGGKLFTKLTRTRIKRMARFIYRKIFKKNTSRQRDINYSA